MQTDRPAHAAAGVAGDHPAGVAADTAQTQADAPQAQLHRRHLLFGPLAALVPAPALAADADAFVETLPGTLPLVFTVPHDGEAFVGLHPVRTQGATVRDVATRALALHTAEQLAASCGHRPVVVIARITRQQLDVNRPPAEAMETDAMLPAYQAYHAAVAASVAAVRQIGGDRAVLIDIHGQGAEPGTVFRGTRGGLTTQRLLARHGPQALHGPSSILGVLAARGHQVHPAADADPLREDPRYRGGHTVATYGSHRPGGIDAIQLEFGRRQREGAAFPADLAAALLVFLRAFGVWPG